MNRALWNLINSDLTSYFCTASAPSYHTLFFCGATMAEQEEADAGGMRFFKAGVPHFTLVLWFKPFREGKLRLPKGFTKEHGAELENEVLFKLPNGAEWQVSVVRGRKRICFVKGWREFAEFYSLKPSNYLVFGLASRNSLNVLIFDTTLTATEIDYPNKKTNVIESECDVASNEAVQRPSPSSPIATAKASLKLHKLRRKNVEERTASGEELDGNDKQGSTSLATESDSTCRPNKHDHSTKTRDKPSLGSTQPHKLRRTDGMERTASSSNGQNQSRTSSIPTEEAGPLARAKAVFKSEKPFFMLVMHPSYIGPRKRLDAPGKFFEENLADKCGDIVLQLPDDVGVWKVKYRVRDCGHCKRAVFQNKSWSSFARDNSLRVGDVCAFELVEGGTEPRLNVTIFRASQDATEPTTKAKPSKNSTSPQTKSGYSHGNTGNRRKKSLTPAMEAAFTLAMEAANAFTSNQPFFKTAVTPANMKRRQVTIPMPFWNHMKKGTRKMELRVGSQVWKVSVNRYEADLEKRRKERVFINGGWGEFAEGNSLVPGDVCIFELIKGKQEEDADADDNGLETTVAFVHVFRG